MTSSPARKQRFRHAHAHGSQADDGDAIGLILCHIYSFQIHMRLCSQGVNLCIRRLRHSEQSEGLSFVAERDVPFVYQCQLTSC